MAGHILIVEDNKKLVEVYRRALERTGYKVFCAYNGKEGLKKLKETKVDLVVLDLKMPKMSGDRFLKVIRQDPQYKDLKVLVISSVLTKKVSVSDGLFRSHYEERPTRISQRAKQFGQAEGKFRMKAKKKRLIQHLNMADLLGLRPIKESDPKFKRRISVALIGQVKEMLGTGGHSKEEK